MGHYPENTNKCTCDTPHGSENRWCDYCKQSWTPDLKYDKVHKEKVKKRKVKTRKVK